MGNISFTTPADANDVQRLMDQQSEQFDAEKAAAALRGQDLMAERVKRYMTRWREALAYLDLSKRSSILDIGSGWVPPEIYDHIVNTLGIDYHAFDINPDVIRELADRGTLSGLPRSNFASGEISTLPFQKMFDLVFSSHCLEHGMDIVSTLIEVRRVLSGGAHLFMSVPLGFDMSQEHLIFPGPDEWTAMLSAVGFSVLTNTLSMVYSDTPDLTILARRDEGAAIDEARARRIAGRFTKAGRVLLEHTNDAFRYPPETAVKESEAIIRGVGSKCIVTLPQAPEALVLIRHPWSGCVKISDGSNELSVDCYHQLHYRHGVDLEGFAPTFTIEVVGKNPLSHGSECVIAGVLVSG